MSQTDSQLVKDIRAYAELLWKEPLSDSAIIQLAVTAGVVMSTNVATLGALPLVEQNFLQKWLVSQTYP